MTKLFKNSKQLLACVMAFAVLAVSLFTGVAINADAANCDDELNVVYIETSGAANINAPDGSFMTGENAPKGTEDDPYIITNLSQLRYLAQKSTYATTHGKFFEIDESIDVMVLQRKEYIGDLDAFLALDAEGTKTFLSNANNNGADRTTWQGGHANSKDCFAGTLNGNGVKIVGAYNVNGGIIAYVNDGATAKNLTVSNCMFETGWFAGSIFGYAYVSDTLNAEGLSNDYCPGSVTFDNVTVHDNYTKVSGGGAKDNTGALFGNTVNYMAVNVDNCLVYDCKVLAESTGGSGQFIDHPYAFGILATGHNGDSAGYPNGSYKNSVFIGCAPYAFKASNQAFKCHYYTNVYTDQPNGTYQPSSWYTWDKYDITVVSTANMKGAKAVDNLNLDWSVWMADDTGYPELRSSHKNITTVDNGDGTHSEVCACGFGGVRVGHNFTNKVCACGAKLDCSGRKTIYWDGSVASGIATGSGTKADPYVIKSASEFAWLIQQKADVTGGKYYEIDPAIGSIVLQSPDKAEDIMALADAAAVKTYFESTSGLKTWPFVGWELSCFAGQFNGNGVTVYGLYQVSTSNAGLFSTVDGGAAIRNIAVKNSYYKSTANNYQVAAIAAVTSNTGYGMKTEGIVWFEGCVVANCYLYNTSDQIYRSGVILGAASAESCQIDNCLVYGNDATYGAGVKMPILASVKNAVLSSGPRPDGIEPKIEENEDKSKEFYYNTVSNTIVLGADIVNVKDTFGYRKNEPACFNNVYTDGIGADGKIVYSNMEATYAPEQIKSITAADVADIDLGAAFIATGAMPELKSFHDAELQITYDENGHGFACSCGLSTGTVAHIWGTEVDATQGYGYGCTECDYVCDCWDADVWVEAETKDPTCTESGKIIYKCENCGYVDAENPEEGEEALGHKTSKVAGKDATCTEPGVKDYYECTNKGCDAVFEDAAAKKAIANLDEWKVIPANGHTHAKDADGVDVYKVTEAGHQKVCSVCSEAYGDVESHVGAPVANGADGHKITCTVAGCGFAADNAEHNFGDDNKCDTCEWTCTAHAYKDGETITPDWDKKTADYCYKIEQICTICGTKGEDKLVKHTTGDWEQIPYSDENFVDACVTDGQHTEVKVCQECFFQVESKIVTDPKTGHSFEEYEAEAPTCSTTGCIAYKQCVNCGNCFALDAADDEAYENALAYEDLAIEVDPDNHNWVELGEDATCDEDGIVEHKYCLDCDAIVIGDEMVEAEIDWDAYYEYDDEGNPVGIGAILDSSYGKYENEALADFIAEFYPNAGIEVPAYPENDGDWDTMSAYYEVYDMILFNLSEIDEDVYTKWEEYWMPTWEAIQFVTRYTYVVEAAIAAGTDFIVEATGHELTKVDEVAATYDKEGTKAHYVCECGKLYADAEGKEEVTAADLVIAKLVKEDAPVEKPEGDNSDKSPATGESVASVAAVAALMGAAFVLVRKSKKA